MLVVFALGESYNVGPPPEIRLGRISDQDEDNLVDSRRPPGTEFFEQAMSLLKVSHENPTIDQIIALNLIVSIILHYFWQQNIIDLMDVWMSGCLD